MKFLPLSFIFTAFILFSHTNVRAQSANTEDSLLNLIKTAKTDSTKVKEIIQICDFYVSQPEKHIEWAHKALKLAQKAKFKKGEGDAYSSLGLYYTYRSNYPKAVALFDSAIMIYRAAENKAAEVSALGNIGNIFAYTGQYNRALSNYLEALEVMKELGKKDWIATANNNIGNIYYFLEERDNAMKYYQNALAVYREIDSKQGMALALGNVGIIYNDNGETDQAIIHFLEAIEYGKGSNDPAQLAGNYSNLASSYSRKNNYEKSIFYYKKSIEILKKLEDKNGLSIAYLSLSEHFLLLNNHIRAKNYVEQALKLSEEINAKSNLMKGYLISAKIDSARNDFKSAYSTVLKYNTMRDTLFKKEKSEQIAEMQTRFDTKAKEKENQLLKAKEEKQTAVIKRKNYLTWFIISVLVLVGISAILLYRTSLQRKKANQELSLKNEQINQHKEEILSQSDNLQKANNEIVIKNKLLNETNEKMTASLNYAGYIQDAMMPGKYIFNKIFDEHFIVYYPKEIVSGDFYWTKVVGKTVYFAAADCTGHGVPGAMVSMLGISFLNELITRSGITETDDILNELRIMIKESFDRSTSTGRRDGLDISLCRLNTETGELQFSGAHNPLFIVNSGTLKEIKGDRMPIGKHRKEKPFKSYNLQVQKGTVLYMYSDGVTDQFGGRHLEKFKKVRLKALLSEITGKPLPNQKQLFQATFKKWKGSQNQLDDILLMGLKV
ncbi:MAG: tetratricopeptide repeat protein [Bacteroidota bacterium]|nr:tetratricopeptide repeat protein [Bacteroidota bacterium]